MLAVAPQAPQVMMKQPLAVSQLVDLRRQLVLAVKPGGVKLPPCALPTQSAALQPPSGLPALITVPIAKLVPPDLLSNMR